MDKKQIVLDFIKQHKIAVIATVDPDNNPESAVLEFGETNELELVFDTFFSSRKYKNLKVNSRVSFVIGWDKNITIQYEGDAYELDNKDEYRYKKIYWIKNPEARRWKGKEGIKYFKVTPKWIRYSDLNKNPWEIFEITEF